MFTFLKNRNFSITEERFGLLIVIDYHIIITLREKKSVIDHIFVFGLFWLSSSTLWITVSLPIYCTYWEENPIMPINNSDIFRL